MACKDLDRGLQNLTEPGGAISGYEGRAGNTDWDRNDEGPHRDHESAVDEGKDAIPGCFVGGGFHTALPKKALPAKLANGRELLTKEGKYS